MRCREEEVEVVNEQQEQGSGRRRRRGTDATGPPCPVGTPAPVCRACGALSQSVRASASVPEVPPRGIRPPRTRPHPSAAKIAQTASSRRQCYEPACQCRVVSCVRAACEKFRFSSHRRIKSLLRLPITYAARFPRLYGKDCTMVAMETTG